MIQFREVQAERVHYGCSQNDGYTQNEVHLWRKPTSQG